MKCTKNDDESGSNRCDKNRRIDPYGQYGYFPILILTRDDTNTLRSIN